MATDAGKPSPKPRREKVIFDKLKPPKRHRKQPEHPQEQVFKATQGRNQRRSLPEKYRKQYKGKHRKDG